MNGKGLVFALLGAALVAFIWHVLISTTGLGLWLVAPFLGLAVGLGMREGGSSQASMTSKLAAVAITLVAVVAVRIGAVHTFMNETFAVTDETAVESMAASIAEQMSEEDEDVYTTDGDFAPHIYAAAQSQWNGMLATEKTRYIRSLEEEHEQSSAFLSPFVLLFDFGIFGTLWTVSACTTAFTTSARGKPATDSQDSTEIEPVRMTGLPGMPPASHTSRFARPDPDDAPVVRLPGMPPPTRTARRFDADDEGGQSALGDQSERKAA
jgi:hypothetical protein